MASKANRPSRWTDKTHEELARIYGGDTKPGPNIFSPRIDANSQIEQNGKLWSSAVKKEDQKASSASSKSETKKQHRAPRQNWIVVKGTGKSHASHHSSAKVEQAFKKNPSGPQWSTRGLADGNLFAPIRKVK